MAECRCTQTHNPIISTGNLHHVCPKSWGGSDTKPSTIGPGKNTVVLCPTTHENVHELLNFYRRLGRQATAPERRTYLRQKLGADKTVDFNRYTVRMANLGWRYRPNNKPPATLTHGEET